MKLVFSVVIGLVITIIIFPTLL